MLFDIVTPTIRSPLLPHIKAFFLAAAVLASPATAQSQSGASGVVTGTVTTRDGSPIAGATVTISGSDTTATTSAMGRFQLSGLDAGQVDLTIAAPGYLEAQVMGTTVGSVADLQIILTVTPNFMERVQVTATKTELEVGDLASQVDIVDREEIDLRNVQSLTQAIDLVPGLVVSTQAGSFESVTLRGMPRDGNEFTTTLLMIDGIPQTDSRNSARVVNLPINDVATIEVMRGPNSALYGRTAIGGSVNVRTADPTPDHQVDLQLSAGDFDTLIGLASVAGPIADWGGYYVSGSLDRNEGFYTGPVDFEVERMGLFGKLLFSPDNQSQGFFSANLVDSDQSTPTNVPIIDGSFLSDLDPRFNRLSNLNLPGPNYHQEEMRLTGRYNRQIGSRTTFEGLFGYREIQYRFIDDGDVTGAPFDLAANTLTMYPFDQQTDEDIGYLEARFEISPDLGDLENSLLLGGSFETNRGFSIGNLIYTDEDTFGWPLNYLTAEHPARDAWNFFEFGGNDYGLDSTGLFAQYILEPGTRWVVTAGARYDRLDLDNTLTLSAGQPRTTASFDAVSPKLSAIYKLKEGQGDTDISLYTSYSEAFLPPRRPSQLRPANALETLEPEDVENFEIGLKGTSLGGKLSFEGTWFDTHRTGIVTTVRQGPFFLPTNAGEHEYSGVELGLRWFSSTRFSAFANAAFYDNRFGSFVIESEDGDTVLTGNRLPISPDEVYNAGVIVRPADDWDVRLDIQYVGDVAVDQNNTFELDAYTLVGLAVSWVHNDLRLTLSAQNLFDEEYYWNGDTSLAESADPGRPRQVLLTAAYRLGFGG